MAHDAHFLSRLDRVTREHTEYALDLYRDHEALKFVLERVAPPAGVERVALAIGDASRGPFVIVTREGHFVTCLGEGMTPGPWPIVPRDRVDALLAKVADKRARREFAELELRPHEEPDEIFQRIITRGSRLSKEDFIALTAFESLLGQAPYFIMLGFAVDVLNERPGASNVRKVHAGLAKAVERHDRLTWAIAHLTLLSGAGDRVDLDKVLRLRGDTAISPTFSCSAQAGSTFLFRSAWLAARLGKAALPLYKRALETTEDWMGIADAAMGIGALGLRHASLFAEAHAFLRSFHALAEADPGDALKVGRAAYGHWIAGAMEQADDLAQRTLLLGADLVVGFGKDLPDGHPYRFTEAEKVPEDLARTTILSYDADAFDANIQTLLVSALATAARAKAEDFYFPREAIRAWFGAWSPDETLYRLERFYKHNAKKVPVRSSPTPGRNDPCTCGSGKKWKKCCGAAGAKA